MSQRMIKKLTSVWVAFLIGLSANVVAQTPTTFPTLKNDDQNFLGGIFRGQYTASLNTDAAASLAIEAGPRNYRANGTLGFNFSDTQRFKLTGEYLRQDIDYNFFPTGTTRQWVQQGAAGLNYQHALTPSGLNYFDISGYYSHAPSKTLDPISGSYVDSQQNFVAYTNFRRIAGSNAYGISPAITVNPWNGGQATVAVNYDNVHYDRICQTDPISSGFGGTVTFNQQLGRNLQANLSAGVRSPFNTYQAGIRYLVPGGNASVGIIGSYTDGKDELPNTSMAGIEVTYTFDKAKSTQAQLNNNTSVTAWTKQPAVYMPQVLAIPEACFSFNITPPCIPPGFSGSIQNQGFFGGDPVNIPTASYFTGTGLTFSATDPNNLLPPSGLSIDPNTGVLSGTFWSNNGGSDIVGIVVTASNTCGSAQSNPFSLFID